MNIVFVTNNYTPYSGGVVSSINAFYDELTHQGHTVTIITLDFGTKTPDTRTVIRLWCPVTFKHKQNYMAVPVFAQQQMARFLQRINPDIVHVHHPFLLGPIAHKIARRMHKPIVFTYHTLYEKYVHNVPLPRKLAEFLVMRQVRRFCNIVDAVIAPSSTVQTLIRQQTAASTTVIPSPLDPLFFARAEGTQYPQRTRFELLTVSRFTKEKNIPFLLDMFAQLGDEYTLTLAGYGNELESLQRHAYTTLQLPKDRVHFIVRPAKEELRTLYSQADVFVYASQTETQGLVMLEAMACGTPVVSLHGPGQQDFIQNGTNGYLVDTKTEMIKTVQNIRKNNALRMQLKKGALHTAEGYTAHVIVKKLVALYAEIQSSYFFKE